MTTKLVFVVGASAAAAKAGIAAAQTKSLVLAIDGLQPEKGHETLYVVRELTQKRVWFAEALLSSGIWVP